MESWNGRACFLSIKELVGLPECLLDVGNTFPPFLLARGQMRVHKHEGGVVVVEAECHRSLIRRHPLRSCLHLDCLEATEALLVEAVVADKKHNEASKHDLLEDAIVRKARGTCSLAETTLDQSLPVLHSIQVFGAEKRTDDFQVNHLLETNDVDLWKSFLP